MERRRFARAWIIGGFALTASGSIANLITLASDNYLGLGNFRADLQIFSVPLSSFAAFWAWWFLSKVATLDDEHTALFRKAFLALAIESLCGSVTFMNMLLATPALGQYDAQIWLQGLGSVGTAIGFFLMFRQFAPEQYADADEES